MLVAFCTVCFDEIVVARQIHYGGNKRGLAWATESFPTTFDQKIQVHGQPTVSSRVFAVAIAIFALPV